MKSLQPICQDMNWRQCQYLLGMQSFNCIRQNEGGEKMSIMLIGKGSKSLYRNENECILSTFFGQEKAPTYTLNW